jgi:hypothetical protein
MAETLEPVTDEVDQQQLAERDLSSRGPAGPHLQQRINRARVRRRAAAASHQNSGPRCLCDPTTTSALVKGSGTGCAKCHSCHQDVPLLDGEFADHLVTKW